MSVKKMAAHVPLSQPTISQHLKELLEMQMVCRRTQGTQSLYCLEWNRLEQYFKMVDRLEKKVMPLRPRRNCC